MWKTASLFSFPILLYFPSMALELYQQCLRTVREPPTVLTWDIPNSLPPNTMLAADPLDAFHRDQEPICVLNLLNACVLLSWMDIAIYWAIFLVSIRRIIMLFSPCLYSGTLCLLLTVLDQGTTQTHLAIASALENLKSSLKCGRGKAWLFTVSLKFFHAELMLTGKFLSGLSRIFQSDIISGSS